jgi:recombination protein RecA
MKLPTEIQSIANKLNKKHGEGTLILGSQITHDLLPRITTGDLALDVALNGGWVSNQWNEIYGNESAGKTALILNTIAANQALDSNFFTVWVASEEFVPEYAKMLGCDVDRIIVLNENGMETAYQFIIDVLTTRKVDCIILDSLPALVPEREEGKNIGETTPGLGALLTGQFFRKQRPYMKGSLVSSDRNITGIIVNQFRDKIGVMYGDPRTTPGGKAKNFHFFTRVEVRRDEWIEDDDERVGMVIKARIEKNKGGKPQRIATIDFHFADHGVFKAGEIDRLKEIVALGIKFDVFGRKGTGIYTYGSEQWRGRNALIEQLREDLTLQEKVSSEVMAVVTRGRVRVPAPVKRVTKKAPRVVKKRV